MLKLSFVIPCYNSEKSIKQVVDGIREVCKNRYEYQILLSNDGSRDRVWDVIRELCSEDPSVEGICLAKNFGQQCARMAAIPHVEGDYVVFMDDDGQHPADGIPKMVEKLEEGFDIVYAYFASKKERLFRVWGSNLNQRTMEWLMGKPRNVKMSSFFVARRFIVDELNRYKSPGPVINGYFMQLTKNIACIELEHQERIAGKSGYNLKKLVHLWMNNATSFSVQPLRLASLLGVCMSGLGFIWALYLVIKKLVNPNVMVGYTSIVVVILICSGLLMLLMGLIGEYIGRLFLVANNIPQYVVRERINVEEDER